MASANGSGDQPRKKDDDPERTQRTPAIKEVVNRWFNDDPDDDRQAGGR